MGFNSFHYLKDISMGFPRDLKIIQPVESSLFNPVQFQTRSLLSSTMSAMWSWFNQRLKVSFPMMISEFNQSLVIVACEVEYAKDYGFFEGSEFEHGVDSVQIRQKDMLCDIHYSFKAHGQIFARVRIVYRFLVLNGDDSLSASPGKINPAILNRFLPNEIDPAPVSRLLPMRLKNIEEHATPKAKGRYEFVLYRHLCEVADQWSFIEVPAFASQGRELMVRNNRDEFLNLSPAMNLPLKSVLVKYSAPFFLFDEGAVETTLWESKNNALVFVHRVYNLSRGGELAALVIEEF